MTKNYLWLCPQSRGEVRKFWMLMNGIAVKMIPMVTGIMWKQSEDNKKIPSS